MRFTMIPALLIASARRRFVSPTVQVCFMSSSLLSAAPTYVSRRGEMQKGYGRYVLEMCVFFLFCPDESFGVLEISIKEFLELEGGEIQGWVSQVI